MLGVWGLCIFAYGILPYQLLERQLTIQGAILLAVFIASFMAGTLMVPTGRPSHLVKPLIRINAKKAELWLKVASVLASVFFILDVKDKSLFDLALAYELRSDTADALLKGEVSNSSVWFQLAFLFYPAGYVYIAVHALYARQAVAWKLLVFGFLPIVLATVGMGGRVTIFYAAIVAWIAFKERKKLGYLNQQQTKASNRSKWLVRLVWFVVLATMFYYFATVFMIRAAVAGGSMEMFVVAEERWGVGFRGPMSGIIFAIFGEDFTYLIFIFAWYLVQGLVMSNYLFSAYEGPLQMGIYGLDLMSALMRRLDPLRVAEGFDSLLTLGTYGFLPSAWGSLYVDFGFASLVPCAIWGAMSALCYRRIVLQSRTDWLLIGPFVSIGIMFSIINTPLGFTNGLVTHAWLLFAFFTLGRQKGKTVLPLTS
jgi:hypothetical protein